MERMMSSPPHALVTLVTVVTYPSIPLWEVEQKGGVCPTCPPPKSGPAGDPNFSRSQINVLEFEFWLHLIFAFLQISVLGREFCKGGTVEISTAQSRTGAPTHFRKTCIKRFRHG